MVQGGIIVFYYVDDIVFCYFKAQENQAEEAINRLSSIYNMKMLGEIEWFLGVRVLRDRTKKLLWLSQEAYIEKMANKFGVNLEKRLPDTPMAETRYSASEGQSTIQAIHLYQQKIGSALFAAITTRLDIAFAVSKLAQFSLNPSPQHEQAALRIFEYLYHTKGLAIQYGGSSEAREFLCFSDSSFADNKDRKSSQGWMMHLFGGPVAWKASKQATVTTSSTEAELLALSDATREAMYQRRLFEAIGVKLEGPLIMECDNVQTLDLVRKDDLKLNTRLRHVDIHNHWLRQEYREGRILVEWLSTDKMPADGLTKPLPRQKHENFTALSGMVDISTRLAAERRMKILKKRIVKTDSGVQIACLADRKVKIRPHQHLDEDFQIDIDDESQIDS